MQAAKIVSQISLLDSLVFPFCIAVIDMAMVILLDSSTIVFTVPIKTFSSREAKWKSS